MRRLSSVASAASNDSHPGDFLGQSTFPCFLFAALGGCLTPPPLLLDPIRCTDVKFFLFFSGVREAVWPRHVASPVGTVTQVVLVYPLAGIHCQNLTLELQA